MKIYNAVSPKLICLPKIHKQVAPMRAIVACTDSRIYSLCKFIFNLITNNFPAERLYNIKDTFDFVNKIGNFRLPMIIYWFRLMWYPFSPIVQFSYLWQSFSPDDHWYQTTKFTMDLFVVCTAYFQQLLFAFDYRWYLEIFGAQMGLSLILILAQIVMDHLLDNVTSNIPFDISFIYKYIDDLTLAVPRNMTEFTLQTFNKYNNPSTIDRKNWKLTETTFLGYIGHSMELSTLTGTTNQPSQDDISNIRLPTQLIKINTVVNMLSRIIHIWNEQFREKNLKLLLQIFLNNGYPEPLLKSFIFDVNNPHGPPGHPVDVTYRKLPQINNRAERMLKTTHNTANPNNIHITKYNPHKLKSLFANMKNSVPLLLSSNVVYKIPSAKHLNGSETALYNKAAIVKSRGTFVHWSTTPVMQITNLATTTAPYYLQKTTIRRDSC